MLLLAAPKGSAAAVAAVAATAMVSDETKEWLSEHKKPLIGAAVLAALVVALLLYIFVFRKWWGTSSAANVGATTTAMGKTSGGSLGKLVAATEAGTGSEPTTYKVTMKTAHGKFVTLTPTGTVEANRSVAASDWEHVTIVVAGPPYAAGGNATLVALKSSSGKWVGMSGGCGKLWVSTAGAAPGPNELFLLFELGGSKYALSSHACRLFVSARAADEQYKLSAERKEPKSWEQFELTVVAGP